MNLVPTICVLGSSWKIDNEIKHPGLEQDQQIFLLGVLLQGYKTPFQL